MRIRMITSLEASTDDKQKLRRGSIEKTINVRQHQRWPGPWRRYLSWEIVWIAAKTENSLPSLLRPEAEHKVT